MKQIMMSETA